VLLQTYQPTHFAVRHALQHDFLGFYREEVVQRRELAYVPYARLVAVRVDAGDENVARNVIEELAKVAHKAAAQTRGEGRDGVALLGPAPAPISRIRGRFRMRFMLRSRSRAALRFVTQAVVARIEQGVTPARAHVDVDPVSML
jgi:primosomal protein N' (replication factor Y)